MTRPLRIQFSGATYHVTARGNRKTDIYHSDADRFVWLHILEEVCARFSFVVHGYCQMGNHYHLLVETLAPNLALGMRHLNGVYSQYFNRRHDTVGHIFQGRYKAILVQKESYLLELSRYIVLNPVRAQLVKAPGDWHWSSYQYMTVNLPAPEWLETDWLLGHFGTSRVEAISGYQRFIHAGIGVESPLQNIRHQAILGDTDFASQFKQEQISAQLQGISRQHRGVLVLPLETYQNRYADRDEAIARAYFSTAYSMGQISQHFNVSQRTVSRAIKKWERTPATSGSGPASGH